LITFDHLGALTAFGDEFLVWGEEVDLQPRQGVDLVEWHEFGRRVVAVVADGLAHHRPVLLLHVAAVVLGARPRPGEGDLLCSRNRSS
jgi:hypothetical protein